MVEEKYKDRTKLVNMLKLSQLLQDKINTQGINAYPFEGCGLLLGRMEKGVNIVSGLFPVPNSWAVEEEKRVRFRISGTYLY